MKRKNPIPLFLAGILIVASVFAVFYFQEDSGIQIFDSSDGQLRLTLSVKATHPSREGLQPAQLLRIHVLERSTQKSVGRYGKAYPLQQHFGTPSIRWGERSVSISGLVPGTIRVPIVR